MRALESIGVVLMILFSIGAAQALADSNQAHKLLNPKSLYSVYDPFSMKNVPINKVSQDDFMSWIDNPMTLRIMGVNSKQEAIDIWQTTEEGKMMMYDSQESSIAGSGVISGMHAKGNRMTGDHGYKYLFIYDPSYNRNVPVSSLTPDQLKVLMQNPASSLWSGDLAASDPYGMTGQNNDLHWSDTSGSGSQGMTN
jgi:hypothetical protein